ncbi:hypothetical protein XENOCAPTIV_021391 [Xenoophorus captivus]|uniref:Receptor-type tyrosine-protein phosphatase U-like Fn3 domain-containing protein n=1 Tax=Xenoophorus captivus TaxID=1517983 RepID=A0ABV0SAZ9_9TELE
MGYQNRNFEFLLEAPVPLILNSLPGEFFSHPGEKIKKLYLDCNCRGIDLLFISPSAYQVVVVEEDGSRRVRRRELGTVDCFPTANSHSEAQVKGAPHYYTAELAPSSLPEATPFTVGDNHTYNGYWNSPLDPTKNYLIYFQASSNFKGVGIVTMPV